MIKQKCKTCKDPTKYLSKGNCKGCQAKLRHKRLKKKRKNGYQLF